MTQYSTWYQFKKDLQKESGRAVLNADWLGVKPGGPLPWDDSHLGLALLKLMQRKAVRQGNWPVAVGGNMVSQATAIRRS
jgi:hypothetical protein